MLGTEFGDLEPGDDGGIIHAAGVLVVLARAASRAISSAPKARRLDEGNLVGGGGRFYRVEAARWSL
jgi:hypothetical protein